jgi:L-2-hydroxyglutarate oxidase LhgO
VERVDAIVIGAGVVGLAIARTLAMRGRNVLIVEAERMIGSGTSSRNSEVIHAGIYYPAGSLKARLCVEGRERLYAYCAARGVPHRRCGKLIVAATGQEAALAAIEHAAVANGVVDLEAIDSGRLRAHAPDLAGCGALYSPSTGIIDSHTLMLALLGEAETHGAMLAVDTRVEGVRRIADGWAIVVTGEVDPVVAAPVLVNAAGLSAVDVAARIEGGDPALLPVQHYARGAYFAYSGKHPFDNLVYPVPEPGGLGIHLTLDMGGSARFGPDVTWVDAPDYTVDPAQRDRFADAIRRYWPGVEAERLYPSYAGVRPKLSGPGEPAADFGIDGPQAHGHSGLVNLFGIESPGLTASLAIAEHVADLVHR